MNRIELEPVDRVEITLLMDNVTDPLLVDQEAIARMNWPKAILGGLPSARARVSPTTGVPDALIAEPGFSALVRIEKAGRKRTLLFDTGVSPNGMVENMRRLAVDPAEIEVIVLSHGHWDHVTGMEGLVRVLGSTSLPVMIHPEFWSRRRISFPGLTAELPVTSRGALEEMGFTIVEERQPSFLLDGAVLITGEVDRETPFETGFAGHEALREDGWQADPLILDDQALVLSLRDRRSGSAERVRPRRHRQHGAIRAQAHRPGQGRRDRRRVSSQRSDVRADHRTDGRGAGRALAVAAGAGALHGLEGLPADCRTVPRRVRHGHGRHDDHAGIAHH